MLGTCAKTRIIRSTWCYCRLTIFSAGSNVSGYLIYPGSLANGSFNYQTDILTGTWKLLSALMTPSGIGGDTYTGSLFAIAIRVA